MANSINVSGLPDYIEAHKDELFVKAALGAKTLDYVEVMPNVKYKDALNYIDSSVVFGDGSKCGWDPQGSDIFSQKVIEVKPIKVEKAFCQRDFAKTYANWQLMFEAGRETLPFEAKIAESNLAAIKKALDKVIWQGDSSLSIDGFLAQFASESVESVTLAKGSTITAAVDAAVAALSSDTIGKGINLFLSYTNFRLYVAEQNATCCANRPIIDAASEDITYYGDSRVKIVPTDGLEGKDVVVAASADALVYGTDVEGSEGVFKLWYDEREGEYDFRVLFNVGTAVKFPDEVVYVTISAS